jgi:hypothetical protein
MKGYKKFLKIVCHETKNGKRFYYGSLKMGLFGKTERLIMREVPDNLTGGYETFYNLSSSHYLIGSLFVDNFDTCKKELRKCFLQKIKEIRFDEGYKTKRKFKIWP